jgi:Flp pilus assembly protein TadD
MELGELTEARKSLTIALREEPENIKVMSNLGMVALRSGHKDEAESFFRTVLEFEPGDPVVRNYLESAGTL